MVEHSQTVRRVLVTKCFSVFDYFVGLAIKGLWYMYISNKPFLVNDTVFSGAIK